MIFRNSIFCNTSKSTSYSFKFKTTRNIDSKVPLFESNSQTEESALCPHVALPESNSQQEESALCKKQNVFKVFPKLQMKNISKSIEIKDFNNYYERVSENRGEHLIKEYKRLSAESKAIEDSLHLSRNAGSDSANSNKNRYINILPFDQTRVKVGSLGYPNDYINASYIPFIDNENSIEYIASQGPIYGTLSDFWQMIWEQMITCITMLTQTMEDDKFKCLQYWPEGVGEYINYGNKNEFNVTLIDEKYFDGHIERNLIVKNLETMEERKIVHLHMHTWCDYSAPNLDYFDRLLFRFQEIVHNGSYPCLVHCSAGVGRTGTLICIDRIVKKLAEGYMEINIYETILNMRRYRNLLVQRPTQYLFIHEYMNHFISKYANVELIEEDPYFNDEY